MDPALQELLESTTENEEIEAIIRVRDPEIIPPQVRPISSFGNIITCRIPKESVQEVWSHDAVESVKASRSISTEHLPPESFDRKDEIFDTGDLRSTSDVEDRKEKGRNVLVAGIDWGIDFASQNFLNEDGSTRLVALWDQSADPAGGVENRYGYGRIFLREEIDQALQAPDPYEALGYHPAKGDSLGIGAHGTHVFDIAAGNGRQKGSLPGISPGSDLLFVHLAAKGTSGLADLGDSVRLLEAIDFISRTAKDQPWVINLSVGRMGGEHSGRSLVEQGMDAILLSAPGRAIVQSTGNYFNSQTHSAGRILFTQPKTLSWIVDSADKTPNEMEVWYPGRDRFRVQVKDPSGESIFTAALGERTSISLEGQEVGRIYHRANEPNSGDHHIDIFLYKSAPTGRWSVMLKGENIVDGRFWAWVERDVSSRHSQSRFDPADVTKDTTLGTICNGFETIVCGAYDPDSPDRELAFFSSKGPTRDGRAKPNIVAPGVDILATKSTPRGAPAGSGGLIRKSGTSMATPHVTGTVALILGTAKQKLNIAETRSILLSSAESAPDKDPLRVGHGYLDIPAALKAARLWPERSPANEEIITQKEDADEEAMLVNEAVETEPDPEINLADLNVEEPVNFQFVSAPDDLSTESLTVNEGEQIMDDSIYSERIEDSSFFEEDDFFDDNESVEDQETNTNEFVETAEEIIASRESQSTSSPLLSGIISGSGLMESSGSLGLGDPSLISPTGLFESLAFESYRPKAVQWDRIFEVVTRPGERMKEIQSGDLLVRRLPGQDAHVAVITAENFFRAEELESAGMQSERGGEGIFIQVIESGPFPRTREDRFARRLSRDRRRLDPNNLLLRLKPEVQVRFNKPNAESIIGLDPITRIPAGETDPFTIAELGLALFSLGQTFATSGDLSFSSQAASLMHSKTARRFGFTNFKAQFSIKAHHPRYFIGTQTFWFQLGFDYNGFDIRNARIELLRHKSSSLHSSTFRIEFTPTDPGGGSARVSKIRFNITGRWNPVGKGDVSIKDSYLDINAKGSAKLLVTSELKWVWNEKFKSVKRKKLPGPIKKTRSYDVFFSPPGSSRLDEKAIRALKTWVEGALKNVDRDAIKSGEIPIVLHGYASTSGSVAKNRDLALRRVEAVQLLIKDTAGSNVKFEIFNHGELDAQTPDKTEEPVERRVRIEITRFIGI